MESQSLSERYFSRQNRSLVNDIGVIREYCDALRNNKRVKAASDPKPQQHTSIFASKDKDLVLEGYGKIIRYDVPDGDEEGSSISQHQDVAKSKAKFSTDFMIPLPPSIDIDKAAMDEDVPASNFMKVYDTESNKINGLLQKLKKSFVAEIDAHPLSLPLWLFYDQNLQYLLQLQRKSMGNFSLLSHFDKELIEKRMHMLQRAIKSFVVEANSCMGRLADYSRLEVLRRSIAILYLLLLNSVLGLESVEVGASIENEWADALSSSPLSFELRTASNLRFTTNFAKSAINDLLFSYSMTWKQFGKDVELAENERKKLRAQRSRFQQTLAPSSTSSEVVPTNSLLPSSLEFDLNCCKIDYLCEQLLLLKSAGYDERVIASIQTITELVVCADSPIASDSFERFWESGAPRLGDRVKISGDSSIVNLQTGYWRWLATGSPNPASSDSFEPSADDCNSIAREWNKCLNITASSSSSLSSPSLPVSRSSTVVESAVDISIVSPVVASSQTESVFQLVEEYSAENANALKRKRAADFFGDIDDIESDLNDSKPTVAVEQLKSAEPLPAQVEVDANGYAMVYSRVHGYRIPIKVQNDGQDQIQYKKVLQELRGNDPSVDIEVQELLEQNKKSKKRDDDEVSYQQLRLNLTQNWQSESTRPWKLDALFSSVQWRPLRATQLLDAKAADEEPDRVVMYSDIQFLAECAVRSDGQSIEQQQQYRLRCICRMLSVLGLLLPNSSASHSHWQRTTMSLLVDHEPQGACSLLNPIHWPNLSRESFNDLKHFSQEQYQQQKLQRNWFQTILQSSWRDSWFTVQLSIELQRHHEACIICGAGDSRLSFTIRLLQHIVHQCVSSTAYASRLPTQLLSRDCVVDVCCCLLELICQRYFVELSVSPKATDFIVKTAEEFQAEGKKILEYSQSLSGIALADGSLDLRVYCSYLVLELSLGNEIEVIKISDKLLKVISASKSLSPGSTKLCWLVCSVLLQLDRPALPQHLSASSSATTSANSSYAKRELQIGMYDRLLYTLSVMSTVSKGCSTYEGYLKDLSAVVGSSKKKAPQLLLSESMSVEGITDLSSSCCEALTAITSALFQRLQDQVTAVRNQQALAASVGTIKIDVDTLQAMNVASDIGNLTTLSAWCQYICITLAAVTARESLAVDLLDSAVRAAESVFATALQLITSTLLPNEFFDPTTIIDGARSLPSVQQQKSKLAFIDIPIDISAGFAHRCEVENVSLSSTVEQQALLTLEQLHRARITFYGWIAFAATEALTPSKQEQGINASPTVQQINNRLSAGLAHQYSHSIQHKLHKNALCAAVRDFPLNRSFLKGLTVLELSSAGGINRLRNYYSGIIERRIWGSCLQAVECKAWLDAELQYYQKRVAEYTITSEPDFVVSVECSQLWRDCQVKLREIIERCIQRSNAKQWPWIWMFYMHLECYSPATVKKVYYRAIQYCGWHKLLYSLPQGPYRYAFVEARQGSTESMTELAKLLAGIENRGFFLRAVSQ